MEKSDKQEQKMNKLTDIRTFNVPFDLGEIKENIIIESNIDSQSFKERILNKAIKLHSEGNILEAEKYYKYFSSRLQVFKL